MYNVFSTEAAGLAALEYDNRIFFKDRPVGGEYSTNSFANLVKLNDGRWAYEVCPVSDAVHSTISKENYFRLTEPLILLE